MHAELRNRKPSPAHLHAPRGVDEHHVAAVALGDTNRLGGDLGGVLLVTALVQGHLCLYSNGSWLVIRGFGEGDLAGSSW